MYVCSASGNGVICDAEPGAPEPETCNLQDDDCDGRVDEGTGPDCGSELCDGEDNDGDGRVDEGEVEDGRSCESELEGLCQPGFTVCEDGELICEPRTQPTPERCNEIDDDCDGEIDEDAQDLNRCGDCGPTPVEICNGLDENCNGTLDDGAPCPEGSICACGGCAPPCSAGECGNGGQCIDGYCITDQCPEGYVCRDGRNCTPGERENQPDAGAPTPMMDAGVPGIGSGMSGSPEVDDCKCDFGTRRPSTWTFLLMLLLPLLRTRKDVRVRP